MKILVPFKSVPTAESWGTSGPPSREAPREINPFDAIALEEAIVWRERGAAREVVGVTIGGSEVEEQARAALAMGCDRVLRVSDARPLDPYAIAKILRAVVLREDPRLVLMGKQAVDDDSNQVGQMLAGCLGWPQATFVSQLELAADGQQLTCTRETDSGLEVIRVSLPAIVTTDLRLNEPRYVSLPGLIKARRKPIETVTTEELGVAVEPLTKLVSISAAPARPAGRRVASVDELMDRLEREAKVLT
jgi:electron transfer flavoprotein beta subunit